MAVSLKDLSEQTIVITGASSGIGLATAREAATRGAQVVLAARNEEALEEIVDEIVAEGGEAMYVVADVTQEDDVRSIAEAAVERFGKFDTWINNAAVSVYGSTMEIDIEDQRRIFETNYWGLVYGSRVAVEHLRDHGGAVINMGSVVSDRAIPRQGPYCASKAAIKGFTDALRMEVEEEGLPISVTLIKPSVIDTPYKQHAKNYFEKRPTNPPPAYTPELVTDAILYCAQNQKREVTVGGAGRVFSFFGMNAPRLTDKVMELVMTPMQKRSEPAEDIERHNLQNPAEEGKERSERHHYVRENSLYTRAVLNPVLSTLALLGTGAVAAAWWMRRDGS